MEGIVQAVHHTKWTTVLEIATSEGRLSALAPRQLAGVDELLIDAKVRLRGNDGPVFNSLKQMTGTHLLFPGMETILVEEAAPRDPFLAPIKAISGLLKFEPNVAFRHRVHVSGRMTMYWPGRLICIQNA